MLLVVVGLNSLCKPKTCQFTSACSTVAAWWGVQDIDFVILRLIVETFQVMISIDFASWHFQDQTHFKFSGQQTPSEGERLSLHSCQRPAPNPCFAGGKWDLEHFPCSFQQSN